MRKSILILIAIFYFSLFYSQSKLADVLYSNFEYASAAKVYSQSESLTQKQKINFAFSYYYSNEFQKSIPIFREIVEKSPDDNFLRYHYGIALKSTGRYKSSKKILNELYKSDSLNKYLKLQLESIDSLIEWDTAKIFKKLTAFEKINSNSSEFSPSFFDDGVYYIVEKSKEKAIINNISFLDKNDSLSLKERKEFTNKLNEILAFGNSISPRTFVYKMKLDFSKLFKTHDNPIPNSAILNLDTIISHKNFNVTSYASNYSNDKVFYTRHPYLNNSNSDASLNPIIYQGKLNAEKKKIYKRRRIPVRFLSGSVGSGEVSASSDGKTIYFVSDKRKGMGQTDIYVAHQKKSGVWGKAINLGPLVNTLFREGSPKIYDDSILYFSSNGLAGYGKADIFKCKIINDSVFDVHHLPYPINSPADDLGFIIHPFDESIGILNSNRSKGKGDDDIYLAHMVPIAPYVKGYVFLASDSSRQSNTTVRLLNYNNEEVSQFKTAYPGKYRFNLAKNKIYKIIATKKNYYGDTIVISDETLFRNERKDIKFLKDKTIQGYTVLRSNNEKIPNVKVNINNGINSKKLTIYSDENGYYQFAFNTDSILLVEGSNENLYGIQEFNIDSNYILKKNHNLLLDSVMKEFKGKVINEKSNQLQSSALVYLINMDGIKIDSSLTDSTGHFFFNLKIAKDYEIHAFKGKADGVANIHTSILYKNEKDIDVFITEDYTPSLGKVVDSETEEPLNFVKITIVDSTTNSKDISYTNDFGNFELHLHENNIYYLIIEKRNYFTKTLILNIGDSLPKTIDLNKDYNLKLSKSGFLIEPIYFDFKSHKLTKNSRAELDSLANYLKKNKSNTISIFGYTDCLGTEEYLEKKFNVVLGKNRATATRRYLESKGIARSRVNVIGRGAVNFVNSCFKPENCTDLEHRENRRCEFQLNDI